MLQASEAKVMAELGSEIFAEKLEEVEKAIEYAAKSGLFETEVYLKEYELTYVARALGQAGYMYALVDCHSGKVRFSGEDGTTPVIINWHDADSSFSQREVIKYSMRRENT